LSSPKIGYFFHQRVFPGFLLHCDRPRFCTRPHCSQATSFALWMHGDENLARRSPPRCRPLTFGRIFPLFFLFPAKSPKDRSPLLSSLIAVQQSLFMLFLKDSFLPNCMFPRTTGTICTPQANNTHPRDFAIATRVMFLVKHSLNQLKHPPSSSSTVSHSQSVSAFELHRFLTRLHLPRFLFFFSTYSGKDNLIEYHPGLSGYNTFLAQDLLLS